MDAHATEGLFPPTVGQLLKKTRETSGVSLSTVAEKLRINLNQLKKLENDDETLTCDVYTLGFLKLYAQYLNLNTSELVHQFKTQITALPSSEFIFPTPLPEQGTPHIRLVLISLGLFLLLAAGMSYHWWKTQSHPTSLLEALPKPHLFPSTPQGVISPQPKEKPTPSKEPSTSPQTEVAPPPAAPTPTRLKATEKTWVEVRDTQGTIVLRRLFFPGESYEFKTSDNLTLTTGNAKGLEIVSGEKVLTFPGIEVKRGISLNPEKWATSAPTAPETPILPQQKEEPLAKTSSSPEKSSEANTY